MNVKIVALISSFALVALVGYIDFLTPTAFAYLRYYLIPILLAAWFGGFIWGSVILATCFVLWITQFPQFLQDAIVFWDLFSRVLFCLAIMLITLKLKRSYEKINSQKIELENLERTRDTLTHMLIHDLKTPLTLNSTSLQLLRREDHLSDRQERQLDMAFSAVQDMQRMISNLLEISQMEEEKIHLNRQESAVSDVAAEVVEQIQPIARRMDDQLTLEVDGLIPPSSIDRDKIRRVLDNLVNNSLKYTRNGIVAVKVFFKPKESAVHVQISDTGKGIKKEDLGKLFRKFSRLDPHLHTNGHGLGLTYSKMVVEAHGGKISADSPGPGKGSTFTFILPAAHRPV